MNKNVLSLLIYTALLLGLGIYRLSRRYGGDVSDVINVIILLIGFLYFLGKYSDSGYETGMSRFFRYMHLVLSIILVFNASLIIAIQEIRVTTEWFYCYVVLFVCAIGLLVYIMYREYTTKEDVEGNTIANKDSNKKGQYKNLRY